LRRRRASGTPSIAFAYNARKKPALTKPTGGLLRRKKWPWSTCDRPRVTLLASNPAKGEIKSMNRHHELADLERQHQTLEREIQSELARPGSDDLKVSELKRRKLQVKDEIERLRHVAESGVH
jgi:hypothetical protein